MASITTTEALAIMVHSPAAGILQVPKALTQLILEVKGNHLVSALANGNNKIAVHLSHPISI
jgi:hypothetical protein